MEKWVQRYEIRYAHDITQKADGTFVTYEAYKQLQDRIEQQQAKPSVFRQKVTCALLDSRSTEEQCKVALELLHEGENIIEWQQDCIGELKRNCEDFRWLYDQRALGPLDAAAQYGPDYEPPTDEQCLEIRGNIEQAIAKAGAMLKP